MKPSEQQLTQQERMQRAKNKIQLMRRQVKKSEKDRLLALIREYVAQEPLITVKIIQSWLKKN